MTAAQPRRTVSPTRQAYGDILAWITDAIGFLGRTAWPVVDLLIRVQSQSVNRLRIPCIGVRPWKWTDRLV
jgi:hypothetical protein